MQLNSESQIDQIALKTNFAIINIPAEISQASILPKMQRIAPEEGKKEIGVDSIRDIANITNTKQSSDLIIVAENAEKMNANAANAFLKSLEEPKDKIHYIFLTQNIAEVLPTIRSRAQIYYLPATKKITEPPAMDESAKKKARDFIAADQKKLVTIADGIAKLKDGKREAALKLVDDSILLLFKSYFITGNEKLLPKLEKLCATHDTLSANGNIRLQLVANML